MNQVDFEYSQQKEQPTLQDEVEVLKREVARLQRLVDTLVVLQVSHNKNVLLEADSKLQLYVDGQEF